MKKLTKTLLALALVFCAAFAIACVPSNVGDAVEKLAKEGYTIVVSEEFGMSAVDEMLEDADGDFTVVVATKDSDFLYAIYFEKSKDAKELFEEYKSEIKDISEYIDVVKLEGAAIIVANDDAWEDFEK